MQAKKCDRCGCFYESCKGINNYLKRNKFMLIKAKDDYDKYSILDLCPECMEGLMKWLYAIKNGKEG